MVRRLGCDPRTLVSSILMSPSNGRSPLGPRGSKASHRAPNLGTPRRKGIGLPIQYMRSPGGVWLQWCHRLPTARGCVRPMYVG